ncbi:MAG: hypothetical protein J7K84_04970 [Deltaproteobacteria bacterium]|nr:hypothetical protein [Deltaproteobacteria bacterium]
MTINKGFQAHASASDDRHEYRSVFRKQVFELLRRGYERLDPPDFQDSEEEDITGELIREIRNVIEDRLGPSWAQHYAIHDDPKINTPGRLGKRRLRLDIEFERTCADKHPRYPFEAKRLFSQTHEMGKYLGPDGLRQFLSGNYACEQNEAGMIGYVQSETPLDWARKAHDKFVKNRKMFNLCFDGEWKPVDNLAKFDNCYRSKHNRPPVGKSITLFHMFLSFC